MSARLRELAREVLELATPDRPDVAAAVAGTRLYLPGDPLPPPPAAAGPPAPSSPVVEVTGESSLAATLRLAGDVACLNFASARSPGGGFLNGAQAQEESLARGSALYHCLQAARPFYDHHRADPSLAYSDRVIYSPAVPVFRDGRDRLLPAPYPVTFLTCAAPNATQMRLRQPSLLPDLPALLRRRASRILAVAAAHGHRRLVLGAWGCGVFGNDPVEVAAAFAYALDEVPAFDVVVFAVMDRPDGATRRAFTAAFR